MKKIIGLNTVFGLLGFFGFVFSLCWMIHLHKSLNDWEVAFSVLGKQSGEVELTASAAMEGNAWRYFRGLPQIEIHGIDFPCFFENGGEIVLKNQSSNGTETLFLGKDAVMPLRSSSEEKRGMMYRISPCVTEYKKIGNRRFVDVKRSKSIQYQPGVNKITILLQHFSGDISSISAALRFRAMSHRLLLLYPTLCTMITGVVLLLATARLLQRRLNMKNRRNRNPYAPMTND